MQADKISFGTNPLIGDSAAYKHLPQYKKRVTEGIYNAFVKLKNNGADDLFCVNIGVDSLSAKNVKDMKKCVGFSLFTKNPSNPEQTIYQSSFKVSSKKINWLISAKRVEKFVLEVYEKLTKSEEKAEGIIYNSASSSKKKDNKAVDKITKLVEEFGFDDWQRA